MYIDHKMSAREKATFTVRNYFPGEVQIRCNLVYYNSDAVAALKFTKKSFTGDFSRKRELLIRCLITKGALITDISSALHYDDDDNGCC